LAWWIFFQGFISFAKEHYGVISEINAQLNPAVPLGKFLSTMKAFGVSLLLHWLTKAHMRQVKLLFVPLSETVALTIRKHS